MNYHYDYSTRTNHLFKIIHKNPYNENNQIDYIFLCFAITVKYVTVIYKNGGCAGTSIFYYGQTGKVSYLHTFIRNSSSK
jgi:hypothetical protein